jgi:hypothetical protein
MSILKEIRYLLSVNTASLRKKFDQKIYVNVTEYSVAQKTGHRSKTKVLIYTEWPTEMQLCAISNGSL